MSIRLTAEEFKNAAYDSLSIGGGSARNSWTNSGQNDDGSSFSFTSNEDSRHLQRNL